MKEFVISPNALSLKSGAEQNVRHVQDDQDREYLQVTGDDAYELELSHEIDIGMDM